MIRFLFISILMVASMAASQPVSALPADHFTTESVLSSGNWVRVRVERSGICLLPAATLRQWGFSDPQRVRVYGYGGYRKSDALTTANYVDDLPPVQSLVTDRGVVFYAQGPELTAASDRNNQQLIETASDYSNFSYYYISENDSELPLIESVFEPGNQATAVTTYTAVVHHEQELATTGETAAQLVGEDFRYTPTRTIRFDTPGAVEGGPLWYQLSFISATYDRASVLKLTLGGKTVNINVSKAINDSHIYGNETVNQNTIDDYSGQQAQIELSFAPGGTCAGAWLNYLCINYTRHLELPTAGYLTFDSRDNELSLGTGSFSDVELWDVTDPAHVYRVNAASVSGRLVWKSGSTRWRRYTAFSRSAQLPGAVYDRQVANQNLHALGTADMVIFTWNQWADQARRLADFHAAGIDSLSVHVVDVEQVYHEFGSGTQDVSALRKFNKMIYDRGTDDKRLKYVLLMASPTHDERHNLAVTRNNRPLSMPAWQTRTISAALSDNSGYGNDDFIGMLEDGEGASMGSAYISVAVGRLPITSNADAKLCVDKIEDYANKAARSAWRNRILMLADDGNNGVHAIQSERFVRNLNRDPQQPYLVNKIYIDAYKYQGMVPTAGREEMYRYLDEGVLLWSFIGHGNPSSWTDNGMLTFNDINNFYVKYPPVIYAATCDFLRWDSNTTSGGELMYMKRNGGLAAMICATRPVNISDNSYFTNAMGYSMARRDELGRIYPLGEIYRWAKNNLYSDGSSLTSNDDRPLKGSNTNKLKFTLMADPAMRLAIPSNVVRIDSIDGIAAGGDTQLQIKARALSRISGSVVSPVDGSLLSGFNGQISYELYDADQSKTTLDHAYEDVELTYDIPGGRLAAGAAKVTDGRFSFVMAMPEEVSQNWRNATLSMHAVCADATNAESPLSDAAGIFRDFYVYDVDSDIEPDNQAPVIESMVLNHPTFIPGMAVHATPTLLARISDDRGINLSQAGVGRSMTITVDDTKSYSDVSLYYTPDSDGSISGEISYPLPHLTDGAHRLRLRVWDTDGNFADAEAEFTVDGTLSPKIIDVYTDVNPAHESANFYVTHNQPDAEVTVTVSVYTLNGRRVWSRTEQGRSDRFTTMPVNWNLCDGSGRRVARGIYVYRATVTTAEGVTEESASRKLAVAAQ